MNQRASRRTVIAAATILAAGSTLESANAAQATPGPEDGGAALPQTPAGQQLRWIISIVNGVEPLPSESTLTERFAADFLSAVPPVALVQTLEQLKATTSPITDVEIAEQPSEFALGIIGVLPDGSRISISISVEQAPPNKINGLLFAPYSGEDVQIPVYQDWSELESALLAEDRIVSISVTHWSEPSTSVHALQPSQVVAIGSLFKLYVLAAVVEQIERGVISWDQPVEVRESLLSIPSGVTQNEAIGTMISVEILALRMISISDNTATDMLIDLVGRESVEDAQVTLGNSAPERNRPFLTTREMTILKLGDASVRSAFIAGDESERRDLLTEIAGESLPGLDVLQQWTSPRDIESIEWFATMVDLENALKWLQDAWSRPGLEPLKAILTSNPGVPVDSDRWVTVAFKGGSEPGVMALAWLLERADGEVFTFATAVNNERAALDEQSLALTAAGGIALLTTV